MFSEMNKTVNEEKRKKNIDNTLKKVQEVQIQLQAYENLLKNKEEKLEERSIFIDRNLETLNKQQYDFQEEKLRFYEAETVFKKKYEKYKEKKLKIHDLEKKSFEMQQKTEENYKKSEYLRHQLLSKYEILKKNEEKIKLESKLLLDQLSSLSIKKQEFEKLQEEIDKNKKIAEEEKDKAIKDRAIIKDLKEKLSEERKYLQEEIKDANISKKKSDVKSRDSDSRYSISSLPENLEINVLIENLQNQITIFNNDISIRETLLIEREEKLQNDYKELLKNSEKYRLIEKSLKETKNELLEINTEIIPEFEKQYQELHSMISEVNSIKTRACEKESEVNDDADLLLEIKLLAASHQVKLEKKLKEIEEKEKNLFELSMSMEEKQESLPDSKVDMAISELE